MRKLTAGNKGRFIIFSLIVIAIISILIIFLDRMLNTEKEQYEITKDVFIYDSNYEHIDLTKDAIITKKWTGKYYLHEAETGLSYELGTSNIGYDTIKNRLSLFGNFYEVSLDGEVTKQTKITEISDMINSKLYKIDDRKYLVVGKNITVENSSLTAENYLIVIIDKSGNTRLLNNNMDIKTINALVFQTDAFKFDVANEKLLVNDAEIDLTKIIGSTNEYKPAKEEKDEQDKQIENKEQQTVVGGTSVNVGGSTANSSSSSNAQVGGTTIQNNGSSNSNSNSNNSGNSNNNNSNPVTNVTKIEKSINLRSVSVAPTYLDVNYVINDPESKYHVVYLYVTGVNYSNTIALDKTKQTYRIDELTPNTEYKITIGYRITNIENKVESATEDIINVRTSKLKEELVITKVTRDKVYFNLKLDNSCAYDSAKLKIYIDNIGNMLLMENVNVTAATSSSGWTSSIDKPSCSKLILRLEEAKYNGKSVNTDLQATIKL